jgi:polyphosphate kinase 2 (PPK2 family)
MGSSSENGKSWPSRKDLAVRLGVVQREAADLGIPSIVVIEGLDGSGKGLLLNQLILEIDARAYDIYSTHAGDKPARDYPLLWRMWNHTPVRGKLQFFDRSAYYLALDAWAEGDLDKGGFERAIEDIRLL